MDDPFRYILVTGGGGLLARALAGALARRGLPCAAPSRADCDITRADDVGRAFAAHRPTLVFNCAAHTKVDLCEDEPDRADAINGHAVGLLAGAAREHGSAFVHFSTDAVFDGAGRRPYRPGDPTGPISAYGRSKLLGETILHRMGLGRCAILRTAWLFGEGGACFPKVILDKARLGQPLRVVNDQFGSPTYAADLAEAAIDLAGRGASGTFHVTNAGAASWYELARATLESAGVDADLSPVTTEEWLKIRPKQARRTAYSVLDGVRCARALGRPMRPWREALHDYVADVRRAGGSPT